MKEEFLIEELTKKDWNFKSTEASCSVKFNVFHNELCEMINHFTPLCTKTIKYKKL